MYLIKVVEFKKVEEYEGVEVVVGLYSTRFVRIEKNLITLLRTDALEPQDTVLVPKEGKVYIMDAQGNTLDTYYP